MAVAFNSIATGYTDVGAPDIYVLSYGFTNTGGNALCAILATINSYYGFIPTATATYGGQPLTISFNRSSNGYYSGAFIGGYLLNAPTGLNTLTFTCSAPGDVLASAVMSFSGVKTSGTLNYSVGTSIDYNDDASHTYTVNVTSTTNDVVAGFAYMDPSGGVGSQITGMNGTPINFINLGIYGNYLNGSSPTTADTATGFFAVDGGATLNVAAWAFSPPGAAVSHAYLGYSKVANQIQTTPGNALGVVGNASAGLGNDVGGGGVVDVYTGVS